MILRTKAFLDDNPDPSEEEIKEGLSGNLCRCTGYTKIVEAVTREVDGDPDVSPRIVKQEVKRIILNSRIYK